MHDPIAVYLQELERERAKLRFERARVTCYALLIVLFGVIAALVVPGA